MRLHHLTLQAFGPFPGRESIDFDALDSSGIVLVDGPTGSGKTSLLDAVAFVLFGDVPGSRRSLRQSLRSDHAAPQTRPLVELEFSAGADRWRIERSPGWEAPKKRGSGMTTRPASVTLQRMREGQWEPVSTRIDEVAETVKDILGMGLDQFSQVVLLPQGEFAQFLRAHPEDRRQLLEKLFDVARFDHVERWFTQQRQQRRQAADASLTTIRTQMALVDGTLQQLASPEIPSPEWEEDGVETLPAQVRSLLTHVRRGRDEAVRRADVTAEMTRAAERAAQSARWLGTQARQADQAYRALERWPRSDVDDLRHRIDAAAAVSQILRLESRAESARRRLGDMSSALETLAARLQDDTARAPQTLRREELSARSESLTAIRGIIPRIVRANKEIDEAHVRWHQAATASAHALATHRETSTGVQAAQSHVAAADDALRRHPDVAEALRLAHELVRLHTLLARRRVDVAGEHDTRRAAQEEFAQAERAVVSLRTARLAGIAGELAAGLSDEDPCPVCGALDHPHPAAVADDAITRDMIEEAENAAQQAESRRIAAETAVARAQEAADAISTRIAETVAALSERHEDAEQDAEVLRHSTDRAQALVALLAEAQGRHEDARNDANQARTALATAQSTHAAAESGLAQAGAHFEAAITTLQAALARHGSLLTELSQASTGLHSHHLPPLPLPPLPQPYEWDGEGAPPHTTDGAQDLAQLTDAVSRASREHAALVSTYDEWATARQQTTALEDTYRAAARELDDELVAKGYDSAADAHAVAMPEEDLEDLRATWQQALEERAAAEATLRDPETMAAAYTPLPDTSRLNHRSTTLGRRATAERSAASRWEGAYSSLTALCDTLTDAVDNHLRNVQEAKEISDLAETFTGGGENTFRMRLTSYVLAARLETVTTMANERLARMSDGRYQLAHTDARAARGRQSGLGLHVIDSWTGNSRETATLSGGEAFMASLALALGLGDAVRADSGGMELHTLFVDEGFGSLDQDTLEHVMDVLDELREGGRLVGIVSHVSELRARIPTRIDIRKSSDGSTIHTTHTSQGERIAESTPE